MPLTAAEKTKLKNLKALEKSLEKRIFSGPAAESPATLKDLARYDKVVSDLFQLEVKQHGLELAEKMAVDRTMKRVAAEQLKAGQRLIAGHQAELKRLLKALDGADEKQALAAINRAGARLQILSEKGIKAGMEDVNRVANMLDRSRFVQAFGQAAMKKATEMEVGFAVGLDKKLVEQVWKGQRRHLFALIGKQKKECADTVLDLISLGTDARKSLGALEKTGFPRAKVSGWVSDLGKKARAATTGSPEATKAFNASMRQARAYVEDLLGGRRGAKGVGTKGAGKQLLRSLQKAVDEGSETAIKRAVEHWVDRKTLYNSVSAMRTATNETYRQLQHRGAMEQPYVYAMRRVLSSSHPKNDVCDMIAAADLGLGKGVYPIGIIPAEHPGGLCRDDKVIDKSYLKTGKPLAFSLPKGMEAKIEKMGYDGEFGKMANQAKDAKGLQSLMKKHGMIGNEKISLTRASRDQVPDDNILRRGKTT